MPRISKKFALLLVLAMLATMFVGMGTVSAAASYSAGSVVSTSTGNHDLGRFKVAIPATELQNNDWVDLRLPSDFKFNIPDGTGKAIVSAGAGVYTVAGGAGFDLEFPSVKNAFTNGVLVGNITVDKLGDAEVKINFANPAALVATTTEDTAYFYVNLNSIYVDSSSPASVQVNVSGNSGSCFVDGAVTVATYGSGTVNLSIDSVKTITDSISGIDNIRIKEDRPGAWNVYDTIKLKLPNGFVWAAAPTAATISSIDGTDIHAGILADINGDSGRTLKLTNNLANTTTAAYVMIKSLAINVDDETIAKTGDVVIDVSGTATSAPSSFTAAKYGDYTVTASAVGDPTQVVAGGVQQKIGKFAIEESVKES
ncbi:MAG TPA: hypothetical protein VN426_00195, partial [Syntrophomonadaceae bacterium]|nr:hypothetical protein [Syntrophomonadaceae bacterium]